MQPLASESLDSLRLISTRQLAKLLDRKQQTIRAWLSGDKLPPGLSRPSKIKGKNYWRREDIQNFMAHSFPSENNQ
ncbi:helix-turn-helix domain-containing protein [Pectobacterium brasiliense]|uniref:helix-turn-helix domain-containing protein n=1 Tax=Pectobacterium brasiliense TaxID=180957 RepID=UPI00333E3094